MGRYRLVVMSNAVAGREDEYNNWYSNQHLADVVEAPGMVSARRYKLRSTPMGVLGNQYMAIYEMDAENPEKAYEEMMSLAGTSAMPLSDAIDMETLNVGIFEVITDEVARKGKPAVAAE